MLEDETCLSSSCVPCGPVACSGRVSYLLGLVATGLCLVICVGTKLLPLLDCVHFGGLVCHLYKKLTA